MQLRMTKYVRCSKPFFRCVATECMTLGEPQDLAVVIESVICTSCWLEIGKPHSSFPVSSFSAFFLLPLILQMLAHTTQPPVSPLPFSTDLGRHF